MTTGIDTQISIRRAVLALAVGGIALMALAVHGCTDAGCVRNSECDEGFECQAAICVVKPEAHAGSGGEASEAGTGAAGGTGGSAGNKAGSGGTAGGTSGGRGGSGGGSGAGGASGGRGGLGSPPAAGAGAGGS